MNRRSVAEHNALASVLDTMPPTRLTAGFPPLPDEARERSRSTMWDAATRHAPPGCLRAGLDPIGCSPAKPLQTLRAQATGTAGSPSC